MLWKQDTSDKESINIAEYFNALFFETKNFEFLKKSAVFPLLEFDNIYCSNA